MSFVSFVSFGCSRITPPSRRFGDGGFGGSLFRGDRGTKGAEGERAQGEAAAVADAGPPGQQGSVAGAVAEPDRGHG